MSEAKTQISQLQQNLRYRDRIIALLGVLLALFGAGYWRMPTLLSVHVPPDLSRPQIIKPDEIAPISIYTFAEDLMIKLNYCREDCGKDYLKNLGDYQDYLTPRCREERKLHRERNASLYDNRAQRLLPTGDGFFDPEKVVRLSRDVWEVHLEFLREDHVRGVEIDSRRYHYPLRIVHYPGVPLEKNPFQMAFDCYLPPGPQPVDGPARR